jgi:hypothetical protein
MGRHAIQDTFVYGILLLIVCCAFSATAATQMVANTNLSVDTVSRNEARLLFLMRRSQWPDGQAVQVFVLADEHPQHQAFCKNQLQIYPRKLRKAWERRLFSGTGQVPVRVDSVAEMLRRVGSTPGAIGYLPGNQTDDSVKVLQIR